MELKPYSIFSAICLGCAAISGGFGIAKDQSVTNANQTRTDALKQIVNYRTADSCWQLETKEPLTIGTVISVSGKSPTACFYDPANETYAYAAYLNKRLQVLYTFSQLEVNKGVASE